MIIRDSLHKRYNRNHSPKCMSWDGSNTTSKIVCTDASRSIRKANDWTFACLVNYNGITGLVALYSDYFGSDGIAITLDSLTSGTSTFIRIIDRGTNSARYYNLGSLLEDRWISIIVSYNSATNEITIYCNGVDVGNNTLGNKTYLSTSEWALGNDFGLYCVPGNFASSAVTGLYSSFCILDKQADNDFVENFNIFGKPDSASYNNVTFFANLDSPSDMGSYIGLECDTISYNPSSTTKEIEFIGFTDEQLALNFSTVGITPNCLLREFYTGNIITSL